MAERKAPPRQMYPGGPLVESPDAIRHVQDLADLRAVPEYWQALAAPEGDLADEILEWLGKLALLSGVPFNYLVPDARMLPPESLRFFFVDPNWAAALLDGAQSIGRVTTQDCLHDAALADDRRNKTGNKALNSRRSKLMQDPLPEAAEPDQVTGFLLRSAVVAGWPGLEVEGYLDKEYTELTQMLLMVRLSRDVLLCLFKGKVESVNIHEPREGITFGGRPSTNGNTEEYDKMLRGIGCGKTPPGDEIPNSEITIPMRAGGNRIVDIAALKQTMVTKLTELNEWSESCHNGIFTSAEFTLEIVQGADQQHFINQTPATVKPPQSATAARARRKITNGNVNLSAFLNERGQP